jgi:hypothetical protein
MKNFYHYKHFLFVFFMAALLFWGCEQPGGTPPPVITYGSEIDINSKEELEKIGQDHDCPLLGKYTLKADVTLENWIPIGSASGPFSGTFDGNHHKITIKTFAESALSESASGTSGTGLGIFGWTKGEASAPVIIKNLEIRTELDLSINEAGDYYVGALVGCADEYTKIQAVMVEGSLDFSNSAPAKPVYVGGIAGALIASELKDSIVKADITGFGTAKSGSYNYVGGLVGMFDRNQVTRGMNPAPIAGVLFAGSSIINCSSSGDVSGSTGGAQTNVFVGGIAGGSCYGMKTYYSGKIEDCFSTGNVAASGGGNWSWAGGIAGTISGDGYDNPSVPADGTSATGPTRIVRCYAAGTITTTVPGNSWPYVGGIVGYNYYGAVISQSYFTGSVVADSGSDYTGGIAGYNSKQPGHSSRIEDCWSSGTVTGFKNAGGIVGQNQVNTFVRRCYSTAAVSTTYDVNSTITGVGGIAGMNASAETDAINGCVALNVSIAAARGTKIHRVAGTLFGSGALGKNLAWSGMPVSTGDTYTAEHGADKVDGEDGGAKPPQAVYEGLGWDFTDVWKMGAGGYPVLRWQN